MPSVLYSFDPQHLTAPPDSAAGTHLATLWVPELSLEWDQLPAGWDVEQRLSRMTRWVLDADALGVRYAMRLPGVPVPPDAGPAHRAHCLELLATWGLRDAPPAVAR